MPEFLRLMPPDEARSSLLTHMSKSAPIAEEVETASALGRVTFDDVHAPHPLPEFPRSTVDGYAVQAADTFGATESTPAYLTLAGEVPMGGMSPIELNPGSCAGIHTGGALPSGADAVLMLENAQKVARHGSDNVDDREALGPSGVEIEVLRSVAQGENVIRVGEDVSAGESVMKRGTRLRAPEIGGLMALGITHLRVARKPRVALISSGDEVVAPSKRPNPGQVRDVNAYALAALVSDAGGEPTHWGIVRDEITEIMQVASRALDAADMLLISGGSSASTRDLTSEVINGLGKPGVLVHGINVRPGKPTILAVCDGKPVIGLPGNPVSALVISYLFVVPVIESLLGLSSDRPQQQIRARLLLNLPSQAGREDWWPVRLRHADGQRDQWDAEPVFAKSNLIFSLSAAQGLVRIAPDLTGLSAGEMVDVHLI